MHETTDYFLLRPDVEKAYGYSHAVKIGADIKISGAVAAWMTRATRLLLAILSNR